MALWSPGKCISHYYCHFPELRTAEEAEDEKILEEKDFDCTPHWFSRHICFLDTPEARCRHGFEHRKPALGLSSDQIQSLAEYHEDSRMTVAHRRKMFHVLRYDVLLHLIPCSGFKTVPELIGVLKRELQTGIPAPIPEWYQFPKPKPLSSQMKVGYFHCARRGCYSTEDTEKKFGHCSQCKIANYCSPECQRADWFERHKKVCKKAREMQDMQRKLRESMPDTMKETLEEWSIDTTAPKKY